MKNGGVLKEVRTVQDAGRLGGKKRSSDGNETGVGKGKPFFGLRGYAVNQLLRRVTTVGPKCRHHLGEESVW